VQVSADFAEPGRDVAVLEVLLDGAASDLERAIPQLLATAPGASRAGMRRDSDGQGDT